MNNIIRRMPWNSANRPDLLVSREWLVCNGLGGYASGTVAGVVTRRYHGYLVAGLSAPFGRMVMFNHLAEILHLPNGEKIDIGGEERDQDDLILHGASDLKEFRLENGVPIWTYQIGEIQLERMVHMPYQQNTVHITYRFLSAPGPMRLELRPSFHFRHHESEVSLPLQDPYTITVQGRRCEIQGHSDLPVLRLILLADHGALTLDGGALREVFYRTEATRGYDSRGTVWSPGYFRTLLGPGRLATLVASTEPWPTILALKPEDALTAQRERAKRLLSMAPPQARSGTAAELVLAADQFIISPVGRAEDAARARASGDETRTVIAGYHWFTDWGRDTMISLEGLTITTGRYSEAGWILRTFAHHVRDGLIPNLFPEGEKDGLYHTADASLWFFHALRCYLDATDDRITLRQILPKLRDIADHHLKGTRFNLRVDPADGLLHQGQEGYQLTWMDAKVGDWVVTPRRGKAVEINALWFNALRQLEIWLREEDEPQAADLYAQHAERARQSFNRRFWYAAGSYLYDVVDGERGDDAAMRPNQILSISLPHPILDQARWKTVLHAVKETLLTPVGLRSLGPGHPDYKSKYFGDLRARDAAYHQGTVWAWLIGPFINAWLKVHPEDRQGARRFLEGFVPHLDEACIGSISEVFDAEAPYTSRGCIAQAWSVAEVLRCWVKTGEVDPSNQLEGEK